MLNLSVFLEYRLVRLETLLLKALYHPLLLLKRVCRQQRHMIIEEISKLVVASPERLNDSHHLFERQPQQNAFLLYCLDAKKFIFELNHFFWEFCHWRMGELLAYYIVYLLIVVEVIRPKEFHAEVTECMVFPQVSSSDETVFFVVWVFEVLLSNVDDIWVLLDKKVFLLNISCFCLEVGFYK